MFDEFVLNETLVDYQIDWITEQSCEDCGAPLQIIAGEIYCPDCDITYAIETTILRRREVN